MENFINVLRNIETNEIVSTLYTITNHLKKGYITQEDKIFIEFFLPLLEFGNEKIKLVLKGGKNG